MAETKVAPLKIGVLVSTKASFERGVSCEKAFTLASGGTVLSNKNWDSLLVGSDRWYNVRDALPVWTGTMTAYEEPGKPLGKIIEFEDRWLRGAVWIFPVPAKFQGEKDAILVVEHPNFKIETDEKKSWQKTIVAEERYVTLIKNFPAENGWYLTDPEHGIPCGARSQSADARGLTRLNKHIGPVARCLFGRAKSDREEISVRTRMSVHLDRSPFEHFGVVVDSSEGAGTPEKALVGMKTGVEMLIINGPRETLNEIARQIVLQKLNATFEPPVAKGPKDNLDLVITGPKRELDWLARVARKLKLGLIKGPKEEMHDAAKQFKERKLD